MVLGKFLYMPKLELFLWLRKWGRNVTLLNYLYYAFWDFGTLQSYMWFPVLCKHTLKTLYSYRTLVPTYPATWCHNTENTHTYNINVHCHVGVKLYEIGAYSTEDSSLWAYDAVWLDRQFLTYQRIIVPSSLWSSRPRQDCLTTNMKILQSLKHWDILIQALIFIKSYTCNFCLMLSDNDNLGRSVWAVYSAVFIPLCSCTRCWLADQHQLCLLQHWPVYPRL